MKTLSYKSAAVNVGTIAIEMQQLTSEPQLELLQAAESEKYRERLQTRIIQRTAQIGVVGLGYVGLSLAVEWAKAGFFVTGIDIDTHRINMCQQGKSWISDVASENLEPLVSDGYLTPTTDLAVLAQLDAVAICVPTPLNIAKEPDLEAIIDVVNAIASYLHPGQLIVLESTTYPGTTDELILPCLQQTGLQVGVDFFLAFSPERIDPGNTLYSFRSTPKVVAGITPICLQLSSALYETVVDTVFPVSSTRTAELVKLFENTFRAVNIGLANELTIMSNLLGVDVWEVLSAAGTKPYGFTPFYPGPGVGGHCIPIDLHYLAWKMRTLNFRSRFIEVASEINEQMPHYVIERISRVLNEVGKCLNGSRILIVGVAYKRDVEDVRESPAIDIIKLLRAYKAHVEYTDPYVSVLRINATMLTGVLLDDEHLQSADCVVIVTDHSSYDYEYIARMGKIIVDTRNAAAHIPGSHIKRL
jgi:UDP-N-acetyl-D-glucosamine dehydrogenase